MKITISRHAKRRMKLYSINENDIKILIKENIQIKTIGKYEIIAN